MSAALDQQREEADIAPLSGSSFKSGTTFDVSDGGSGVGTLTSDHSGICCSFSVSVGL